MAINSINFSATSQQGDKLNKSVTDINANATGSVLHEFARRANALTTNTLGSVNRVSKVTLDDEKLTPTLTITPSSATYSAVETAGKSAPYHVIADINYDGDGVLDWTSDAKDADGGVTGKILKTDNGYKFYISLWAAVPPYYKESVVYTVTASETDNYHAASATFTITG